MRDANPWSIVRDQFCPFRHTEGRRLSVLRLLEFIVLPLVGGAALALTIGAPGSTSQLGQFIAVISIVAAVMVSMIAIVHSVAGMTRSDKTYLPGQWILAAQAKLILEVLRDLYAQICYSVLIQIASLVPLVVLIAWTLPMGMQSILMGFVYAVAISVTLSFLHIITGVYLVLDKQAERFADDVNVSPSSDDRGLKSVVADGQPPEQEHEGDVAAQRTWVSTRGPTFA